MAAGDVAVARVARVSLSDEIQVAYRVVLPKAGTQRLWAVVLSVHIVAVGVARIRRGFCSFKHRSF